PNGPSTPPRLVTVPLENPSAAKPRRTASSSVSPASSVKENARPRTSTHWMRSATGGPGCLLARIGSGAGRLGEIEQPARFQFAAHQPFRDLAIAGLRQRLPEEEALRHLVARHLWRE